MMKSYKNILLITISLIYSCQDMELSHDNVSQVVVDAVLSPQEAPVVSLKLLGDINGLDQVPVTDAGVFVYSGDKTYEFTLSDGNNGTYVSKSEFDITAGKDYQLEVSHHGNVLYSETKIPNSVTNINLNVFIDREDSLGNGVHNYLEVKWSSSDNSYFYATLQCDDSLATNDCNYFYSPEFPFFEESFYFDAENLISEQYYNIVVYSMTEDYVHYFYGSSDFDYNGNVENGFGIFTGINLESISFQYLNDSIAIINK